MPSNHTFKGRLPSVSGGDGGLLRDDGGLPCKGWVWILDGIEWQTPAFSGPPSN
jgi:hypothetical protein